MECWNELCFLPLLQHSSTPFAPTPEKRLTIRCQCGSVKRLVPQALVARHFDQRQAVALDPEPDVIGTDFDDPRIQ
jgi:hypothetical protein